jgi:cbb3-type cytochrome oxidase subunit 3
MLLFRKLFYGLIWYVFGPYKRKKKKEARGEVKTR